MWVRLWFENAGKPHQRAYTLVDPDPAAGTFSLEFALHDGCASDWARNAQPGDTIEATRPGHRLHRARTRCRRGCSSSATPPRCPRSTPCSTRLPEVPATIWFETPHATDAELPVRLDRTAHHELRQVPRRDDGADLVDEVRAALPGLLGDDPGAAYVWIACDTATTRSLTAYVRKELALPKERVNALGYWRAA